MFWTSDYIDYIVEWFTQTTLYYTLFIFYKYMIYYIWCIPWKSSRPSKVACRMMCRSRISPMLWPSLVYIDIYNWAVLIISHEEMNSRSPFSLRNDELSWANMWGWFVPSSLSCHASSRFAFVGPENGARWFCTRWRNHGWGWLSYKLVAEMGKLVRKSMEIHQESWEYLSSYKGKSRFIIWLKDSNNKS